MLGNFKKAERPRGLFQLTLLIITVFQFYQMAFLEIYQLTLHDVS